MTNSNTLGTSPMKIGRPIGPNLRVTVSTDVESVLGDGSKVTFGGMAPDGGSARGVHWLTQMSGDEVLVAFRNRPGGGRSAVHLIRREDDQGRVWVCVTTTSWTSGLFLSRSDAVEFAVQVAARETPDEGWDYCLSQQDI